MFLFFFFFNDTATTEIYTLSLHDALPIFLSLIVPGFLILLAKPIISSFFFTKTSDNTSATISTIITPIIFPITDSLNKLAIGIEISNPIIAPIAPINTSTVGVFCILSSKYSISLVIRKLKTGESKNNISPKNKEEKIKNTIFKITLSLKYDTLFN